MSDIERDNRNNQSKLNKAIYVAKLSLDKALADANAVQATALLKAKGEADAILIAREQYKKDVDIAKEQYRKEIGTDIKSDPTPLTGSESRTQEVKPKMD